MEWWLNPQGGLALSVALLGQLGAAALALSGHLFSERGRRQDARYAEQGKWNARKFDSFTRIAADADAVVNGTAQIIATGAGANGLPKDAQDALRRLDTYTGELIILSLSVHAGVRDFKTRALEALTPAEIAGDMADYVRRYERLTAAYSEMLTTMQEELGSYSQVQALRKLGVMTEPPWGRLRALLPVAWGKVRDRKV